MRLNIVFSFVLLLLIVLLAGCSNFIQNGQTGLGDNCLELQKSFDIKISAMDATECDLWIQSGEEPIVIGGKLLSIDRVYNEYNDRNEFSLLFAGYKIEDKLTLASKNESLPYIVGEFYKFDISSKCDTIYSMSSSGLIWDSKGDFLSEVKDCN